MCLQIEISSVLLLRMLFSLNNAIFTFSFRQSLHLSDKWLKREDFLRILHKFYVLFSKILSKVQCRAYTLLN